MVNVKNKSRQYLDISPYWALIYLDNICHYSILYICFLSLHPPHENVSPMKVGDESVFFIDVSPALGIIPKT